MSEEEQELIKNCKRWIDEEDINYTRWFGLNELAVLINLIGKQQNKIEDIKQYAEWHISHLTEDIKDYIDDDKNGNADIIGELKEQREHWKDIIRITKNEKTYIDYKD